MYDFAIIGAGAAGLQLALAMQNDSFFTNKKILIIDKEEKNKNDKTWCFWEQGEGKWDKIIYHKWSKALFYGNTKKIDLNLNPYTYKMLKSIDFYTHAKTTILASNQFKWVKAEVLELNNNNNNVAIITNKEKYQTKICFDSRITPHFFNDKNNYVRILQHFKGYFIRFNKEVFNPEKLTLMDFRMRYKNSTSFMYVLPTSSKEALVEFTLFTPSVIEEEKYDTYIKNYIKNYISNTEYEILEVEKGIIPMTNFPFHEYSTSNIIKIGTAGSWVRPSTGYSFKNAERYAEKIINNIKNNNPPNQNVLTKKYMLYDVLLLDILKRNNEKGVSIFDEMYSKNNIKNIFQFLDGTTTYWQDFKIIASFNPLPFLRSILNQLRN